MAAIFFMKERSVSSNSSSRLSKKGSDRLAFALASWATLAYLAVCSWGGTAAAWSTRTTVLTARPRHSCRNMLNN